MLRLLLHATALFSVAEVMSYRKTMVNVQFLTICKEAVVACQDNLPGLVLRD
jgi:hypothetical protein